MTELSVSRGSLRRSTSKGRGSGLELEVSCPMGGLWWPPHQLLGEELGALLHTYGLFHLARVGMSSGMADPWCCTLCKEGLISGQVKGLSSNS